MGRLIPILGAAVVALLIGAGAGWFFGAASAPQGSHAAQSDLGPMPFTYPIKDRVVNLADPGARRYLKVSLALEVPERPADAAKRKAPPTPDEQRKFQDEFKNLFDAKVNDVLTSVLSAKRTDEVTSNDGRERLREELKAKLNALMPKDQQISKVYLTDFIVQ